MAKQEAAPIVVVVVEDEAIVRMVVAEAFDEAGFDVFEANRAREAVDILKTEGDRVHALFTDVNMPGAMNGIGLAHHVAHHWPWISLLITSAIAPEAREIPAGARFLAKPYRIAHAVRHIREMAQQA